MRAAVFFAISVFGLVTQLRAASAAGWQEELAVIERDGAEKQAASAMLLLSELSDLKQQADAKQETMRSFELDCLISDCESILNEAKKGKIWRPKNQNVAWTDLCREAIGKRWKLDGTRNVVGFRMNGRALSLALASGTESTNPKSASIVPGVFSVPMTTMRGWTVYAVSPDLKQARCIIGTEIKQNTPERAETNPTAPTELPAPTATLSPIAEKLCKLLRHQQIRTATTTSQLLSAHLAQATKDGNALDAQAIRLQLIHAERFLESFHAAPSTLKTPSPKAPASWVFGGQQVSFDGTTLRRTDDQGNISATEVEVIWPGLIVSRSDRVCIAYSPDLRDALLISYHNHFDGELAE